MRNSRLHFALALLVLAIQIAAAAHSPGLHEGPAARCAEGASHLCAAPAENHSGPCALCLAARGAAISPVGRAEVLLRPEPLDPAPQDVPVRTVAPSTVSARAPPFA